MHTRRTEFTLSNDHFRTGSCCVLLLCFVLTLLLSVWPSLAQAQHPAPSPKLISAVDKVVENNGIDSSGPGVAILIHQPGKVVFQKGYGLADLKTGKPITPRTMFELASVSKTFTSTALLILHDRQQLSVHDDIRKHLPELPQYSSTTPIRIRDMLQHVSGLPDYFGFEDVPKRHPKYWDNADYLEVFKQREKHLLAFATGAKYEYNNTNFMLAASIIERVSRRSFGKFLREEIFNPLGMQHSFVYENPKAVPENPPGYVNAVGYQWRKKKELWEPTWGAPPARHEELLVVGDGGVWTNLEDMLKWDVAVREQKLLKPATWKQALTPSRTRDGETNGYGLGWDLYYDDPSELYGYGHEGSWEGFRTSYYRYLTADRTTVLLSNRGNLDTDKFWTALDKAVGNHLSR